MNKKIRTFGHTLKNSLFNPSYGNDILRARFGFSFKFAVIMSLVLALVVAIIMSVRIAIFPLQKTISDAISQFPADLVFTYENGHWEINQPLPYAIGNLTEDGDNFVALLLTTDEDIANERDFRASDAYIALTNTTLYTYDNSNRIQVNTIDLTELEGDGLPSFTLSQQEFQTSLDNLFKKPFLSARLYAPIIGIFIFIFTFIATWVGILFILLFYSFVIWIISLAIFKAPRKFTYMQIYQISLHSIWQLEILDWLLLRHLNLLGLMWLVKLIIFSAWTLVLLSNYQPKTKTKV